MIISGTNGFFAHQTFPMDQGAVVFGRNSTACNVVFPDNTNGISRVHCKVENSSMGCTITDLGSSYGTFVNGLKIQPNVPTALKGGDTFYLGDKSNMFSVLDRVAMNHKNGQVSYVNSNDAKAGRKETEKDWIIVGIIMGIFLVIGLVIAGIFYFNGVRQENRKLERMLEQEQNKGIEDEIFDVIEGIFKQF